MHSTATASVRARAAGKRTLPVEVAKRVWPFLASLLIVAAITWVYRGIGVSNEGVLGFTFLLAVLCVSAVWDFSVAIFLSLGAALAYDYFFLPPVGTFNLNDPMDWVALAAFLITAAIGSRLSTRARAQAREAERRRKEVELLYGFSQKLLRTHTLEDLYRVIPEQLVEMFDVSGAALFVLDTQQAYYAGDPSADREQPSTPEFAALPQVRLDLVHGRGLLPVGSGTPKIAMI